MRCAWTSGRSPVWPRQCARSSRSRGAASAKEKSTGENGSFTHKRHGVSTRSTHTRVGNT